VLAQCGEGSVRDSLSALDQAIACCGNKLEVAEIRALLGAFSLETLHQVTAALTISDSGKMLEMVDHLERSGQNLQHFSRELARHFRNLLVAKVSGRETRLIAGSQAERERLAQIAAGFSEEDLTRYLQLSLDLFRDLQFSLQPRFHLEIGLLKLIQAGRLTSLEEALANFGRSQPGEARPKSPSSNPHPAAPASVAAPASWKQRLHAALSELGMTFTADAVEHSEVVESGGTLTFTAPREFQLALQSDDLPKAIKHLTGRQMKVKVVAGDGEVPDSHSAPATAEAEDEVSRRALSNPEVQRFRELLGGQVRQIRNLKE
jgi:DNA polymerase-3 subunit gamma/tau